MFSTCITISPKTDLSEYLSQLRVVFPAALLPKLYFLSLSRCFRFLISHVPSFLIYCKMQIISFSASPVLFSFPLLSLSKKIILSVSPLHGLCRLSYVSLVSSVFCKDPPVRNSVSEVFTVFAPLLHPRRSENRPVREPVSAPRRFSCQSFVQTRFSIAFALFSVLNFRHFFLLCCEIANYFFLRFPFSLFFSFPLLSLSEKIILSITPLHGLCRLSYVSLVSSVFRKDLPVRNSVSEVFTIFVPRQHYRQPENRPVRPALQALCRLSYFLFVSSVFRKDLPVRNPVSMVFTVFAPCLHHHQPENRPVREPVSAPRRFSCRPFAPSLFSVAFALFSAFNFPCPSFCSFFRSLLTLFPVLLPFYSVLSLFHRQRAALFSSPRPVSSFGTMLAFVLLRSARLSLPCLFFPTPFVSSFRFSSQQSFQSVLLYLIGSYSLLCPFPSSLASLLYPHGLALAPLAFSLRLSVLKNFPILIYINEMTLSTIFHDKTMFPIFFSSELGASSLFQPVLSLSIGKDISLRPCFSYAPNFCAPF